MLHPLNRSLYLEENDRTHNGWKERPLVPWPHPEYLPHDEFQSARVIRGGWKYCPPHLVAPPRRSETAFLTPRLFPHVYDIHLGWLPRYI